MSSTNKTAQIKDFALQSALSAIVLTDLQGVILYVNQAFIDLWKLNKDIIITGKKIHEIVSNTKNTEDLLSYLQSNSQYECEWHEKRADDKSIDLHVTASKVDISIKDFIGYMLTFIDITERKQKERALRESDEKYKQMINLTPNAVIIHSRGDILFLNPAAKKLLGLFSTSQFSNYKICDFIHPTYKEIVNLRIQSIEETGNPSGFSELKFINLNNEIFDAEVIGFPINYEGKPAIQSIARDISDRKRNERILKENNELLEHKVRERTAEIEQLSLMNHAIINNARIAIISTTNQGIIKSFNPAAEMIFGYKANEMINIQTPLALFDTNELNERLKLAHISASSFVTNFEKSIVKIIGKKPSAFESKMKRKDGTMIDVLLTLSVLVDSTRKIAGFVGVATDISSRKAAEKELQIRESYLSAVINNHPGMLWMKDLNGRFVLSNIQNNNFLRSLNSNLKNIIGLTDFDICDKESATHFQREDKLVIETRQPLLIEEPIATSNGEVWFEKVKFPVTDKNGEIIGVSGYSIDIIDRKKEQQQLLMQSAAFESFSLAVLITDKDGFIQWANPAFAKLTGYSLSELIGKKPNILKSGMQNNHFVADFWKTIGSGKVWNGEFINRKKDGTIYYEENTITPVKNSNGDISHFIAIKTDITHRKEMEKALRSSEERWQFALEGTGDGVWDWNISSDKAFFSKQWKGMLGYSHKEIGTKIQEWKKRIHRNDFSEWTKSLFDHMIKKEPLFINEHRLLCKDGSYKWVLARGRVVEWSVSGKAQRIIGTITDISEQKTVEENLIQGIEKERELNDMKSRFVSMASHEFRTPLASILITDETLIAYWDKMSPEQIKSKLEKIRSQVLHLNKIVNDVFQISKTQEGQTDFNPEDVELVKFCIDIVEDINNNNTDNIKIIFESFAESLLIRLDTRLTNQILCNLLTNAIKYSHKNGIINFTIKEDEKNIIIDIKDYGIGIPKAEQKYLFTPFFRSSNARLIQGNGLGLNIVKESVLAQGGNITFVSNANAGTTFTIKLPKELIVNA